MVAALRIVLLIELSCIYKKTRFLLVSPSLKEVTTLTLKLNFSTFIAEIILESVTVEKILQVLSFPSPSPPVKYFHRFFS